MKRPDFGAKEDGCAGIDIFRLVAAFLVVTIHTDPLSQISETANFLLVNVLARLAVPFFFMTSGYFTVKRYAKDASALWKFEKRTLLIYICALLLYLPVNVRNGYLTGTDRIPEILRGLLFEGTFYHLWYLPAAMLGAAVAWLLTRKLGGTGALVSCGALYLAGLLGEGWLGLTDRLPALGRIYKPIIWIMGRTRNGLFFAPLFFVLGSCLRDRRTISRRLSGAGLALGLGLMAAEALTLRRLGLAENYAMTLTLPLCACLLFELLLTFRGGRHTGVRSVSLIVYIIHPLCLIFLRAAARRLGLWDELVGNDLARFLAVAALSLAAALPVTWLTRRFFPKAQDTGMSRAWIELDEDALRRNLEALEATLPQSCEVMAVVKTNAYGHGSFEVASRLAKMGVRAYAVATADEGAALRRYGIRGEILVLGYTDPTRARRLRKYRLTQTLVDLPYARSLDAQGVKVKAQLKIDTGMHRLGIKWDDFDLAESCFHLKNVKITGIFTHLACSESRNSADAAATYEQARRFHALVRELEGRGLPALPTHIQSTYGHLNYPELTENYVRAGLALYGVLSAPGEETKLKPDMTPVLSLRAKVALVRELPAGERVGYGGKAELSRPGRMAILPVGYGDGYPRAMSGGAGYVLIHGRPAPILGAVCMDQLAVDVTDIPETSPGDTATLIGRDGDSELTAPQLAALAGTISNELLCRLSPRLPVVVKNNKSRKTEWAEMS